MCHVAWGGGGSALWVTGAPATAPSNPLPGVGGICPVLSFLTELSKRAVLPTPVLGRHTASIRCGSPPLALAQACRVSSVSGNDSALTLQGRGYLWGAFLGMAWGLGARGFRSWGVCTLLGFRVTLTGLPLKEDFPRGYP